MRRMETFFVRSEDLGTYTTTDEDGNVTTHRRVKTWYERKLELRGPVSVEVALPSGETVFAVGPRVTHVPMHLDEAPSNKGIYARYVAEVEPGEAAALFGELRMDGERDEDAVLVMGELGELRRRARAQAAIVLLMLVIAAMGPLVAFVL